MKTRSAQIQPAQPPATGHGVLVDAGWLDAHLHDPAVRVVEVDVSRRAHDEWHIDGAVLWDVYRDLKDADYRLIGTEATERLLVRSGIGPGATVVFYGYAPALGFWLMKLYGHADVRILDCSRNAWRDEGHPVSSQPSEPAAAGYVLPGPDTRVRAGYPAVRDAIGSPGRILLDVRTWDEYRGERFWPSGGLEPGGRAGHVPSAVHQPIDGLYDERGSLPGRRRPARDLLRHRPRRRRRADHVLHDRRACLHRLVRAQLPAQPRSRPRLRRLVGRMGPDGWHSPWSSRYPLHPSGQHVEDRFPDDGGPPSWHDHAKSGKFMPIRGGGGTRGHWKGQHGHADAASVLRSCSARRP